MTRASTAPITACCSACRKPVPRGRLMCRAHWRLVPAPMQAEVWSIWSRFQNRKSPAHALQTLAEYRRAADAATNFVTSLSPSVDVQQEPL